MPMPFAFPSLAMTNKQWLSEPQDMHLEGERGKGAALFSAVLCLHLSLLVSWFSKKATRDWASTDEVSNSKSAN